MMRTVISATAVVLLGLAAPVALWPARRLPLCGPGRQLDEIIREESPCG